MWGSYLADWRLLVRERESKRREARRVEDRGEKPQGLRESLGTPKFSDAFHARVTWPSQ